MVNDTNLVWYVFTTSISRCKVPILVIGNTSLSFGQVNGNISSRVIVWLLHPSSRRPVFIPCLCVLKKKKTISENWFTLKGADSHAHLCGALKHTASYKWVFYALLYELNRPYWTIVLISILSNTFARIDEVCFSFVKLKLLTEILFKHATEEVCISSSVSVSALMTCDSISFNSQSRP